MQFIWDLLNSSLVIAFISATVLEYIRQKYQRAAKQNVQKVEWLKQTRAEQTKLFNELSNLTATVVGNSQILFKELTNNMKSSVPDQTELKEREKALLSSVLKWEQSYLSICNQIQHLTHSEPKSDSTAIKLFMGDFRTEISATLTEKIAEETTLASAISILCNKTLSYLKLFQEMSLENGETSTEDDSQSPVSFGISANIAMGTALPSGEERQKPEPPEIAKLSEYEREERLSSCWNKITRMLLSKNDLIKWLLDNEDDKKIALCDTTSKYLLERFDRENYIVLLRLEMQKDMLKLTEQVENKINTFFKELNQGFQEHLDTVEKQIIK